MRKQINLGKKISKLVAGILKSDAEGNISAATSADIAGAITPGTFAAPDHTHSGYAFFKKASSTFTDDDVSQTFTDTDCTVDSLVTIIITSVVPPQGIWSIQSANGSFTITSTVAETNDITFDYYVQKAI